MFSWLPLSLVEEASFASICTFSSIFLIYKCVCSLDLPFELLFIKSVWWEKVINTCSFWHLYESHDIIFFGGKLSSNITHLLHFVCSVMPVPLYMLVLEILFCFSLGELHIPLQDSVWKSSLKEASLLPFSLHMCVCVHARARVCVLGARSVRYSCLPANTLPLALYLCISFRADTFY